MLGRIYIYGEPILRKKTKPVEKVSWQEKQLFDEMLKMMHQAKGIGLAANQVGIDKRMCVVCVGDRVLKLANPRILKRKGMNIFEEGCLSLPNVTVKVKRAKEIVCEAINENNGLIRFEAKELLARAIQHEVDHLMGKLIIDHVPLWQKLAIRKKKITSINDYPSPSLV
jgi:peptide deformylase